MNGLARRALPPVPDAPKPDVEIVVAGHGVHEVRAVVKLQGVMLIGRLSSAVAPRAKCLMCLNSSPTRPSRRLPLLSCHRAVGYPPPPRLTAERATTSEIPRRRAKRLIGASAPTISVRTDCRLVPRLFPALRLQDEASAVPPRLDRRSARRRMCQSASLTSRGTMHWTSRTYARRVVTLAYVEQHVACASACRTRCHLRRNTRPSAGQSSARGLLRLSHGQHPRRR
jgi:hypothetical protein